MVFEEIYKAYYPRIYRLCMGYTNDEDLAKDLAQETFIAVWKHLPGFRNEAGIGTWIYRIATNQCLRAIEKAQRVVYTGLPGELQEMPSFSREEQLQQLYRCIATLKETERIIISLVLEGLPHAEIAQIVGISEGNVRVKVYRIKEQLTQQMKQYGQL